MAWQRSSEASKRPDQIPGVRQSPFGCDRMAVIRHAKIHGIKHRPTKVEWRLRVRDGNASI
jgi:hypothetical protein